MSLRYRGYYVPSAPPPISFKWYWDLFDEEIIFMKKNTANQVIGRQMITISDGSDFIGAVSVDVTIDGGTQSAGAGSVTHEGKGYHTYTPTQGETNGNHIAFTFSGSGAITRTVDVYTSFPQSVDNDVKISNIPTTSEFNARTIASASYATAANLATVDSNVDAILVDTNDLQTNQGNWLTATGFATTAEIADVPTVAEFNARTLPSADYFVVTDYTAPPSAASISTTVWSETTRVLTAGTNIVLAKGVGLTGLNDIAATSIVSGGAITTSAGNASVDIVKINGVTITGNGSSTPFDV